MSRGAKPTSGQLRDLYATASEFKQAKLWESFFEMDLICVENPADGTIGYCSIMGSGEEHFTKTV